MKMAAMRFGAALRIMKMSDTPYAPFEIGDIVYHMGDTSLVCASPTPVPTPTGYVWLQRCSDGHKYQAIDKQLTHPTISRIRSALNLNRKNAEKVLSKQIQRHKMRFKIGE